MGLILSSMRVLAARASAAALVVPILIGGAVPASAAVLSHAMVPAVGSHVRYQYAGALQTLGQVKFNCQVPGRRPLLCYGPDQIRAAYDVQPLLAAGITGAGKTIVIVDAYQSPTIESDLAQFDAVWNIPAPPHFRIIAPDGLTPFVGTDPNQLGWSSEISLDVEWAHAIAPGANIDLVLAKSNQDADILSVTEYAVRHRLGDVITQSFGEGETCMDPQLLSRQHRVFGQAVQKGITLFASAGDLGSAQPTCDGKSVFKSASTPASDPNVTAVGGTNLSADAASGAYHSESVWNDEFGAGGGGFSTIFERPDYQSGAQHDSSHRGVPDVTYNGDVRGGVLAAWSAGCGIIVDCGPAGVAFFIFGGTSAGSPQWAGIIALADQKYGHRLGAINDSLYDIAVSEEGYGRAFHDVTAGNTSCTILVCGISVEGFSARAGWDAASGLGSPQVAALVDLLLRKDGEGRQQGEGLQTGGE